jgi:hypothetical protein
LNLNYILSISRIWGDTKMNCGDLKMGQVLRCEACGFELQVVKECGDVSCSTDTCCTGNVTCCGEPMKLKQ